MLTPFSVSSSTDVEVNKGERVSIMEQPEQGTDVFKGHLRAVGMGHHGAPRRKRSDLQHPCQPGHGGSTWQVIGQWFLL